MGKKENEIIFVNRNKNNSLSKFFLSTTTLTIVFLSQWHLRIIEFKFLSMKEEE